MTFTLDTFFKINPVNTRTKVDGHICIKVRTNITYIFFKKSWIFLYYF